ncbi:hypothetical protein J2Z60_001487 [Lactobacillus colini]|uniref:Uncharacterized protein n=1 Tax=Lactobacillus colini TaxID=1819254 RepID=A0ABS4MF62_9LACO|nr:hypothetical protein [Lactobacillus colini]
MNDKQKRILFILIAILIIVSSLLNTLTGGNSSYNKNYDNVLIHNSHTGIQTLKRRSSFSIEVKRRYNEMRRSHSR